MDSFRACYLQMCKAMPGGMAAMAAALGLPSKMALENRIYERKGQSVNVEMARQMQANSRTTLLAQTVAADAEGLFYKLPDISAIEVGDIGEKYLQLFERVGALIREYHAAIEDDEIDHSERRTLESISQEITQLVPEILAFTFAVYCKPEAHA